MSAPAQPAPIDVPLTLLTVVTGLCSAVLVLLVIGLVLLLRRRATGAEQAVRPAAPRAGSRWTGTLVPFAVGDPGRGAAVRPLAAVRSWDRRDTVLDGLVLRHDDTEVAELRAASLRGLAHAANGVVRQDEYAIRTTSDGRHLVAVVADGVSAGRYSDQAAMIVTRRGAELVVRHVEAGGLEAVPWSAVLGELAHRVLDRGRHLAAGGDPDAERQLAATVLFAVVDLAPGPDGCPVEIMGLGDTSAWALRTGGWEPLVGAKRTGAPIASSATAALPALPALPATPAAPVRTTIRPGEALLLVSDGVGDAMTGGRGETADFLAEVWSGPPPSALAFAAHVGFLRKSFDDDRTAVAVWPSVGASRQSGDATVASGNVDGGRSTTPPTHVAPAGG